MKHIHIFLFLISTLLIIQCFVLSNIQDALAANAKLTWEQSQHFDDMAKMLWEIDYAVLQSCDTLDAFYPSEI